MKISFLSEGDAANVLTEYSYCLNKHSDIESKSICTIPHPFNYTIKHDYNINTCNLNEIQEVKQWILNSDVIVFGEEGHPLEQTYRTLREFSNLLGIDLINSGKKLCIWHPGSHYRQNSQFYNEHPLRGKISKHLYAFDLYKLSNKGLNDLPFLVYNYVNFNKKELISNFKNKLKLKKKLICHIPSNPKTKGTDIIKLSTTTLPDNYSFFSTTGISHPEAVEYKTKSLFYIDQFNSIGTYGVAAIEALLNSNLVFCTLHNTHEAITKLTGEPILPFVDLGTTPDPNQINSIISTYANLPDKDLIEIFEGIIQWVGEYYSPKGIINQIENIIK
jgi:hypothetical protein